AIAADKNAWHVIVMEGALRGNGMVSFANNLTDEQAEAIRAYVLDQAWMAVVNGDATAPAP
ncbi:MAG: hypothetical protein KBE42_15050, partial [Steroidobacteraceae bacterium]|nr:hypothetical protein [Steroidobacteraceae bacterium]